MDEKNSTIHLLPRQRENVQRLRKNKQMEHLIEYYEALIKHKKEYVDAGGELKYERLVEIRQEMTRIILG
jgi:hypothetical protein